MSNILGMDKQQLLQRLTGLGWSIRRISRETGIHRKTVSGYRKQFESVPIVPPDSASGSAQSVPEVPPDLPGYPGTKSVFLQPYLAKVRAKLELGLTARRIYQDLVEEDDYRGGYDSVRRYARKLKKKLPKHFDRLPVVPGLEAQVDFGKGAKVLKNGRYCYTWLFKMTLSYSGHSYEELVWKQDMETFVRCHENAFRSFGGVPERIKLDNLKSGVLQACLYEPVLNLLYQAFADYYGFVPDPCLPRRPEHKGRVERDVRYTKDNALKARCFESLNEGNVFMKHWNKTWARTRIHGSKKAQVWRLFTEHERAALKPLPETGFSCFKIASRKVDTTGHIEVAGNFYSVPHRYMGQRLGVHFNNEYIKVYDGMDLVIKHTPRSGKGNCTTIPGHKPAYKPLSQEQAEGWLCTKAKQAGPSCYKLVYGILMGSDNDPLAIRRCRGILSLAKKYPAVIEQACTKALFYDRSGYRMVKGWCESFDQKTPVRKMLTQEHDLIRNVSEYQTIINERSCNGTDANRA